ncbi:MAG TPA: hypothetical protein VI197_00260 [Polyangiaceae bacterium]
MRTNPLLRAVLAGALVTKLAAAEPQAARQAQGLLADVERLVSAEQSLGWVVDRVQLDDMYPSLLESICPTLPSSREIALAELQRESRELGDPLTLYQADRALTDRVEDALAAKRRLIALEHGLEGALRECPFWIEVDPEFEGIQTDRNRFTLNVESGGVAILRQTAGDWTLGAGGFGRVMPAYGFAGSWTLLAGGEFGGGALIRPGDETTGLVVNYFTAAPVVARLRDVSWHYDIELAPVALFQTDDLRVSYGARLGTTVGLSALYTTGVIPWAGVSVAYEYYVESGGRPAAHFIRGGFRAGLSWDP